MADEKQLEILKQGPLVWNDWRSAHTGVKVDLSNAFFSVGADLSGAQLDGADLGGAILRGVHAVNANLAGANLIRAGLGGANFSHANFCEANLTRAHFGDADLRSANLSKAILEGATFWGANLSHADLRRAIFSGTGLWDANLSHADFSDTDLSYTSLTGATLVEADFTRATITGCYIYGISAWNVKLEDTRQSNLVITHGDEPTVTVDNLEVAQFIYLLLNNTKIRDVIDTLGKKGVLILGRFTPERKKVLDALRKKLREHDYVPMMFDFEGAASRDFTETVKILAGMSRFIIADITNPKSSPLELQATVPDYMVPFVPIIQEGEEPFSMFANLQNKYDWVMDVLEYQDCEQLMAVAEKAIIQPALEKEIELLPRKAEETRKRHAKDYLQ